MSTTKIDEVLINIDNELSLFNLDELKDDAKKAKINALNTLKNGNLPPYPKSEIDIPILPLNTPSFTSLPSETKRIRELEDAFIDVQYKLQQLSFKWGQDKEMHKKELEESDKLIKEWKQRCQELDAKLKKLVEAVRDNTVALTYDNSVVIIPPTVDELKDKLTVAQTKAELAEAQLVEYQKKMIEAERRTYELEGHLLKLMTAVKQTRVTVRKNEVDTTRLQELTDELNAANEKIKN